MDARASHRRRSPTPGQVPVPRGCCGFESRVSRLAHAAPPVVPAIGVAVASSAAAPQWPSKSAGRSAGPGCVGVVDGAGTEKLSPGGMQPHRATVLQGGAPGVGSRDGVGVGGGGGGGDHNADSISYGADTSARAGISTRGEEIGNNSCNADTGSNRNSRYGNDVATIEILCDDVTAGTQTAQEVCGGSAGVRCGVSRRALSGGGLGGSAAAGGGGMPSGCRTGVAVAASAASASVGCGAGYGSASHNLSRRCRCLRCRCLRLRLRRASVAVNALPSGGGGGGGGGKVRRVFVCSKCGTRHGQYHGKCSKCGGFGTIDRDGQLEEPPTAAAGPAPGPPGAGGRTAVGGGGTGGGGGGAGVQALERAQQDTAAAAATAAAARERAGPSYSDGDGDGGDAYDGRTVGWVANGDGGGGGMEDVPLSLRALSRMGALGPGHGGRIPLSGRTGAEVQRVLGGGVVPGALVLIGGDPGVGKSTITLQIAAMVAHPEIDFDALEEQRPHDEYDGDGEYGAHVYGSGSRDGGGDPGGGGCGARARDGPAACGRYDARRRGDDDSGGGADPWVSGRGVAAHGQREDGDLMSYASEDYDLGGAHAASGARGAGNPAATGAGGDGDGDATEEVPPPPPRTVLYVTAEETREQVVARSRRMGLDGCDRVLVLCRSEVSAISRAVLRLRPDAVVMDSINTVYLSNLPQAPGTVTQIRECGQLLLRLAKDHRLAVFIIGHVTKGGEMAGPNMLAHMVDTVLYLEGDVAQSVRLLRVVKNRHGSDSECGVFSMDGTGLHAVANHSALFLENRLAELQGGGGGEGGGGGGGGGGGEEDGGASSVVGVTLQGSRAILVEVQALVSPLGDRASAAASSALSYRSATGVEKLRLANLCAILDKHVPTLELSACSVIVNVVGGAQVRDVASDLALAVAIAASYYNAPVPRDLAVCGEVDLAGRVRRSFQRLDVRLREAAKLGFRRVVIPQTKGWERLASDPQLLAGGVEVVAVRSVAEALRVALGAGVVDHRPPHIKPPPRGKPPPGTGPPGSRFSRLQYRTAVFKETQPAPPGIETDGAWPRAAALGGVAAAYAAAATAPSPTRGWAPSGGAGVAHDDDDDSDLYGSEAGDTLAGMYDMDLDGR